MRFLFKTWQLEVACWDNDADADTGADDTGADDSDTGADTGDKKKTFTQEDVNKIVTNRVKTLQNQLKTTEGNYQTLLEQQGLSDEQRTSIEKDLENVRAQMRTKEQQIAHDRKQEQEKFSTELTKAQQAVVQYKELYETSTIERAIVDAAAADAYDPKQFVGLLKSQTKIVDELDSNGQKTGRLVPKIEWDVENPETKRMERVLKDPSEVVEMMKSSHANLFKSNVAKGLGSGNAGMSGPRGNVDVKSMSAEEFMAFRKTPEGARALGLKPL